MSSVTGIADVPTSGSSPGGRVVRLGPEYHLAAAMRLVGEHSTDPLSAAQRFLESSKALRIDLSRLWGTLDAPVRASGWGGSQADAGMLLPAVREVCLAVVGAGRTAMLFVSGARRTGRSWSAVRRPATAGFSSDQAERVAVVDRACADLAHETGARSPVLAQALLETREREAAAALRAAGFAQLGELAYLRRATPVHEAGTWADVPEPKWATGVRVEPLSALEKRVGRKEAEGWLEQALENSYIDTQDCPELCGLRSITDVLESHRAVGSFDPSLWWVVFDSEGRPGGCLLLSVCPDHDSAELVYLGLGPALRGHGLGAALLEHGISALYRAVIGPRAGPGHPHITGTGGLTCAVDTRNAPAMRLYTRAGFKRFASRIPFIRSLRTPN